MSVIFKPFLLSFLVYCLFSCGSSNKLGDSSTTKINLSKLRLKEIPSEVFEMTELKELKLYGNQITEIPPQIANLKNLEKLYLGKNNLKTLPPEIGELKQLKILSVQYNQLESLPSSIENLVELEQLWLKVNQLTRLPDEICSLKQLKNLQLDFNQLISLPDSIGNCGALEFIYINRNNLTELPNSVTKLTRLKELHMANAGNLVDVPEELCDLRQLEVLEIDATTAIPPCLLVLQTNRLQLIIR